MKTLSEKQEVESILIKDWCIAIIEFIYSKYPTDNFLVELRKGAFSNETKDRYLQDLSPGIYLQGLRMARNDVNEMAKGLPTQELEDLNVLLFKKFGKDLNAFSLDKQIAKIVKRGKVNNENEFRIIEERVSELSQMKPNPTEISTLNNLLVNYHISKTS